MLFDNTLVLMQGFWKYSHSKLDIFLCGMGGLLGYLGALGSLFKVLWMDCEMCVGKTNISVSIFLKSTSLQHEIGCLVWHLKIDVSW